MSIYIYIACFPLPSSRSASRRSSPDNPRHSSSLTSRIPIARPLPSIHANLNMIGKLALASLLPALALGQYSATYYPDSASCGEQDSKVSTLIIIVPFCVQIFLKPQKKVNTAPSEYRVSFDLACNPMLNLVTAANVEQAAARLPCVKMVSNLPCSIENMADVFRSFVDRCISII